jgi:hypothetical protein
MKKAILLIIFSSLILTGCQQSTKEQVSVKEKSGSKVYVSKEYKISFEHPSDWNVYEGDGIGGIIVFPVNKKNLIEKADIAVLQINFFDKAPVATDQTEKLNKLIDSRIKIAESYDKEVGIKLIKEKIVLNGIQATRLRKENIKLTAENAKLDTKDYVIGNGSEVYFLHNGQRIQVIFSYPAEKESTYKDIFESILLSIIF